MHRAARKGRGPGAGENARRGNERGGEQRARNARWWTVGVKCRRRDGTVGHFEFRARTVAGGGDGNGGGGGGGGGVGSGGDGGVAVAVTVAATAIAGTYVTGGVAEREGTAAAATIGRGGEGRERDDSTVNRSANFAGWTLITASFAAAAAAGVHPGPG